MSGLILRPAAPLGALTMLLGLLSALHAQDAAAPAFRASVTPPLELPLAAPQFQNRPLAPSDLVPPLINVTPLSNLLGGADELFLAEPPPSARPSPDSPPSLTVSPPRSATAARAPETPAAFQRHPTRNLLPGAEYPPFTLRMPNGGPVVAQLALGLQTQTYYTDNFAGTIRRLAQQEGIAEYTPIAQLTVGDPPGERTEGSPASEYYFQAVYLPTVHELLRSNTSRTVHRLLGELGRSNPVCTVSIGFEYDENLFAAAGEGNPEKTSTVQEILPVIEYHLSPQSLVRSEGIIRQIILADPISNRTEFVLDTVVASDTSVKTRVGAGAQLGYLRFDEQRLGSQRLGQGFATWTWRPTAKVLFQTRGGVELRQFENANPRPDHLSPVVNLIASWTPDAATRVNIGFRMHNDVSVTFPGSLYRESAVAGEATHDFGQHFYIKAEVDYIRRAYDTQLRQEEVDCRPALGYRLNASRLLDSLNLELYYQLRLNFTDARDADTHRNLVGIQSTIYF